MGKVMGNFGIEPRLDNQGHRQATQLELFFDLVIVIAVASLAGSYHHFVSEGHGLGYFIPFCLSFMGIWWTWMNYTWYNSSFDHDDGWHRVLTITMMFGSLFYGGGMAYLIESMDFRVGLIGWIIMRFALILMWLRVYMGNNAQFKKAAFHFMMLYIFLQILWVLLYVTLYDPEQSTPLLIGGFCVFLVELIAPIYIYRNFTDFPVHRGHIIERYGLMNIIVLGEVLLPVGMMLGSLNVNFDMNMIYTALSGVIITFTLWWVYFVEMEHSTDDNNFRQSLIWGYGHYFIYGSSVLVGIGLGVEFDIMTHHAHTAANTSNLIICLAVAVNFATIWLVRDRMYELSLRNIILLISALCFVILSYFDIPLYIIATLMVVTLILRLNISREPRNSKRKTHVSSTN